MDFYTLVGKCITLLIAGIIIYYDTLFLIISFVTKFLNRLLSRWFRENQKFKFVPSCSCCSPTNSSH